MQKIFLCSQDRFLLRCHVVFLTPQTNTNLPPHIIYLLREALQALVGAADNHVLSNSDQTHWVRRQLDAVLWFVRLSEEQQHKNCQHWLLRTGIPCSSMF